MQCIRLSPALFFFIVLVTSVYYYYIQKQLGDHQATQAIPRVIDTNLTQRDIKARPWNTTRIGQVPVSAPPKAKQQELMKTGGPLLSSDVSEPSKSNRKNDTCEPHYNVAFLKVHKSGSTTVSYVLFRLGLYRDLIVALPSKTECDIIGHFGIIRDEDYEPPPGGKRWNIFAHHAIYNRTRFHQLMAPNTRYVTILRQPLERLQSAFHYFKLQTRFPGMENETANGTAHVTTYLKNPSFWDPRFKPPDSEIDRENFCFRNCMARDLGLLRRDYDNSTAEFVQGIEGDFTTVMIMEYLPASLVLLKRRMCWTLYDILYNTHQSKKSKYTLKADITKTMEENFNKHNYVDVVLYDHFKKLLYKQIKQEGADFLEEVKYFERVNDQVSRFCAMNKISKWTLRRKMPIEESQWNDAFVVDRSFCLQLYFLRPHWDYVSWLKYYLRPSTGQKRNRMLNYCGSPIKRSRADVQIVKEYLRG
ncbi:galactosylceramide sulfotransferase-like [Branchiostoma floridae x Branchiostoma japonicum]